MRKLLRNAGITRCMAVDLPGLNPGLPSLEFVEKVAQVQGFVPVPCLRGNHPKGLVAELDSLALAGVEIVKVHPRWLGHHLDSEEIRGVMEAATSLGTVVMLCTYPYQSIDGVAANLHVPSALEALQSAPGLPPVILMHGGGPQFLEVCEWARHQDDVLVDTSYTMTQFATSSVGLDITNALQRFDRRLVLGSDAPFESLEAFSRVRETFLETISVESCRAVTEENLEDFLSRHTKNLEF